MAANGHHHGVRSVLVLYRIVNSDSDSSDPLFNCFHLPYGSGPTLNAVKQGCAAAHSLSHLGPEGYHWRVLVEDKPGASGTEKSFSWWDIQDGNAKLPVKETSQYELRKLLFPSKPTSSHTDTAAKAAKGAFKMMGKVASAVVAGEDITESHGPPVSVLTFKLLDLVKINDDFNKKHGGQPPPIVSAQPHPHAAPAPRPVPAPRAPPAPRAHQQQQQSIHQVPPRAHAAAQRTPAPHQEASLLQFDTPTNNKKVLHHTMSSPPSIGGNPNVSRAERLKHEYEKKKNTANRIWDDVDQRWVEVEPGAPPPGSKSAGVATAVPSKAKVVGIKLDGSSAVGKSDFVKHAVGKRVSEMREQQAKAVNEIREREAKKKQDEEQEDIIRKQLDPKIKAWSEEHGQKKQLRALLATLHTVLWPGTNWKQVTIGDLLDDSKVKRAFHKATLVVHPDKTNDLPPEQRFLAKRIFDALCQAKTAFDSGAN